MDITSLLVEAFTKVIGTFAHNWYLLVISIAVSAALKFYVDQEAIAGFLRRNTRNSVLLATGVAVGTPFCSCGTTAIVLGMMASTIPWAPIVAFIVSSPLTSPEGLFYMAGIFGWQFSIAFFISSILLGLAGGAIASFAESRGWLVNQARMASSTPPLSLGIMGGAAPVDLPLAAQPAQCGCGSDSTSSAVAAQPAVESARPKVSFRAFIQETYDMGKRLLLLFFGFTFVGYVLNGLIPTAWITSLFGSGHAYS